jgi:hypothetical protein
MRNSVIYLGIVVLAFSNALSAANFMNQSFNEKNQMVEFNIMKQKNELAETNSEPKVLIKEMGYYVSDDSDIINPESIIKSDYKKSQIEIIAEDNKIIESSIEDDILENKLKLTLELIRVDNLIIDSNPSVLYFPLDFEIIKVKEKMLFESYNR